MGIVSDALRPQWIAGINAVNNVKPGGFRAWLIEKHYQVYSPISANSFELNVSDTRLLCNAVAADVSRLATAAVESMQIADSLPATPKATAWTVIRAYYAAYYASNAVCRLLGTSVSQLNPPEANSVFAVANIFSQATGVSAIQPGMYRCMFDNSAKILRCTKASSGSGSHEMFWSTFLNVIRTTSNEVLSSGALRGTDVATKLFELSNNLCRDGCNGGNWLSFIRNEVTYRHELGTWFPYRSGVRCDALVKLLAEWKGDPMEIDLAANIRSRFNTFACTSAFLVSLCFDMLQDVARRCPRGRSFVQNGPNAYMSHITTQQHARKPRKR